MLSLFINILNANGLPKEGLRIEDLLVRIAVLLLLRDQVKISSKTQTGPLYIDDIIYRYLGLRCLKFWNEKHDQTQLRAVIQ
ncbi:hypothetical protein L1887_02886 [Cichorium endivia]|nr:hypothetical protein L1887_02886 [Cichorium endivia]